MAVSIRMQRIGGKKEARYHVVVTNSTTARDGKCIEKLGFYDPTAHPPIFRMDVVRFQHWTQKGARPSETVAQYAKKLAAAQPPAAATAAAEPPKAQG